ncbi:GntR family transcriptional regulator [Goodfellowiella coeruleoviolacea]|uniref:DNA-binding transcriptional regulator, GntR family n=1 Tax=Goodfellowiella coeruleoviolacea TaxID=334858 RepID=A0AAE3GJS4_9PSEU|nr:GntR family transcriptional regulator [Goodfellowiella coeruleoviolacea]MCP2169496.1 DNA-binding transcriptional regulator, GntR family [Goodfellowiella coeruleoviolacea]
MISGRDKAYEYLKDTLLADPSMRGRFISEQDVANRIGVSRTPIREALLLLAAEDLVQLVPKKGAYVAPMTGREIAELMDLRGMVERYAAERVLAAGQAPVEQMRQALDRQRELGGAAEARREFIDVDRVFHTHLVHAAGNGMMTRMYEGLRARQVRCGVIALDRAVDRQREVLGEHQAILDGLAAGDVAATTAAITEHLQATLAVLLGT